MGQSKLFSLIDKAVFEYKLIEEGDKILIGASGGKDSTALVEYFAARKKQHRENFEFTALHVSSDFASPLDPGLIKLFNSWDVQPQVINVDVLGRLKEGRKMNCWWCSTQRRTELNNYAIEHGYNKIALGHHLDDILETLLMNALKKGELSTMIPRLKYNNYPVTIIRPLCLCDVDSIIAHAQQSSYISVTCTCNYQENSDRKKARSKLFALTEGKAEEKYKLFEALRNIKTDYLP
ncbi:MAG: tRNA 2-thiocytidine biosynthesis TtcA family protein [Treponemataceae bacterium]|nr:tRNA 2-thiocytidine biosynthesis TtcA family protein [Treponemataceae bacterium]